MVKHAFLILTHKNIDHLKIFFLNMSDCNFYIHIDLKADFEEISQNLFEFKNVFFIKKRIDIKWGGVSMIEATINLFDFSLKQDFNNKYFHLISGDDIILNKDIKWDDKFSIYMQCENSILHRYRMRFDTLHADTKYQRTILGKALTQFYKIIDKFLPTEHSFYFGSQWFSIRRNELEILMKSITEKDLAFFRRKLCPDEHFFQYLIVKNKLLGSISEEGNKRFIVFDPDFQHGSSPIFLDSLQIDSAQKQGYWFARKVEPQTIQEFYLLLNDE